MTFYLSCGVPDGTTGGMTGSIGFRQECNWGTCDVTNLQYFGPFSGYSFTGPPFVASISISGVSFSGICIGMPGTFNVTFDITEA